MTEQTKKLNKSQLKRWKTALKEAAKINRILKTNKDVILYDTSCNDIITVPFSLIRSDNISTLCFVIGKTIFSYGDNNTEADNGIMYNSIKEIKDTFKCFKIYKEIKR